MATTERTDADESVTVRSYRSPEYIKASWPVVSEEQSHSAFIPEEFAQVGDATYPVDEMFADFGSKVSNTIELSREAGDFDLQPATDLLQGDNSDDSGGRVTESLPEDAEPICIADEQPHDEVEGEVESLSPIQDNEESLQASGSDSEICETEFVHGVSDEQIASPIGIDEGRLQEALSESYEKGRADSRQEIIEAQRQLEERYRLLWEDMQTQLDEALRINERRAVELALQTAKRMVGSVVENQREYIHEVIRQALAAAGGAEISAIRVSPRDYDFLKLSEYGDVKKLVSGGHISFTSDESIRAGCILVTTSGEVDFDLDKAWHRIRAKALQEPEQ